MSLFRSILHSPPSESPPRSRRSSSNLLPRYEHELPSWHADANAMVVPPLPVTASMFMSPPPHPPEHADDGTSSRSTSRNSRRGSRRSGSAQRPQLPAVLESDVTPPPNLVVLRRHERQLQQRLQELLDAQADGLMAGLGSGGPAYGEDEAQSNGSRTPTVATSRSRQSSRMSSPAPPDPGDELRPRKKISLRAARRGILRAMNELAALKEEERTLLDGELQENGTVLGQIGGWERKRAGLESEITRIEGGQDGSRARALKEEAANVEKEIYELELKLAELKATQSRLAAEISDVENSVDSRLSSYKSSLSLLESQVNRFLRKPPTPSRLVPRLDSPFMSLPSNRRTLSMAKDQWEEERTALQEQRDFVVRDDEALQEGALIWNDVVGEISAFEKQLQEDMAGLNSPGPPIVATNNDGQQEPDHDDAGSNQNRGLQDIISQMDRTIGSIEQKLADVAARDWKLLVCCIGAELEAFKQGRDILSNAVAPAESGSTDRSDASVDHETDSSSDVPEPIFASTITVQRRGSSGSASGQAPRTFYADDEPDPELLISHQDMDTD